MKTYHSGLLYIDEEQCSPGFTLVAPMAHESLELVNLHGETVHHWRLPGRLGSKAYLLPNGNLLCSVSTKNGEPLPGAIPIPGALGGVMLELDWDGHVVWEHTDVNQHHDLCRLENGNTLYLARELMSDEHAARIKGGVTGSGLPQPELQGKMIGDVIREVSQAGEVVWEWCAKDSELIEIPLAEDCHRGEWAHANSISPAPDGNILISFRHLDTIALIDKASGKLTWSMTDRAWGHQHHAELLPNGHITLFANGMNNLHQPLHSRALELDPTSRELCWEFMDPQRWTFFSPVMGGVQRLANGNTLICESLNGRIFEVTPAGEVVWDFICPKLAPVPVLRGQGNALFRAYRYTQDSAEISARL